MDLSKALIIAALIALARWVFRSLKEPVTPLPDAGARTGTPRPGPRSTPVVVQKTGQTTGQKPSQKRGPTSRPAAHRHVETPPVWNVLLDVSHDAPRSEIQAAAKRRIAQAVSNGDHATVALITRAAATGLKHSALRNADALRGDTRDP